MNSIAAVPRVKVSADGHGVVSHAGVGMLREVAGLTGLSTQVTAALADTYRGPWIHDPGSVFADLAAAVAGGADCIDGVGQRCGDREHVFGPAASTTTMWRLIDQRIDAAHLPGISARPRPPGWPTCPATGPTPTPHGLKSSWRQQIDLVAWTKLIGFTEHRDLATCEIETFRYRVLHVAARITRGARQIQLRIDATWRWATAISQGWQRLRAAVT